MQLSAQIRWKAGKTGNGLRSLEENLGNEEIAEPDENGCKERQIGNVEA